MKKLFAAILLLAHAAQVLAGSPATLLEMSGVQATPARLSESVLVIIDAQQEYVSGALPLSGIDAALAEGNKLLERARVAGTPIIHVKQRGHARLFNPAGANFAFAKPLTPQPGETVIEKLLPNAFAGTHLQQSLADSGRKQLIVIGFMTHMCVSSTVRAALDLGYTTTVVASATASRDLPDGHGGVVPAATVQQAALAALADRFATIVDTASAVPD